MRFSICLLPFQLTETGLCGRHILRVLSHVDKAFGLEQDTVPIPDHLMGAMNVWALVRIRQTASLMTVHVIILQ